MFAIAFFLFLVLPPFFIFRSIYKLKKQKKWTSKDSTGFISGTVIASVLFVALIFELVGILVPVFYGVWAYYFFKKIGERPTVYPSDPPVDLGKMREAMPVSTEERSEESDNDSQASKNTFQIGSRVSVSMKQRNLHMYVIGSARSGKSKGLEFWSMQDMKAGRGVAVVDPHGDLVDDLFASLANEYYERAVKTFGEDAKVKDKITGIFNHLRKQDTETDKLLKKIVYINPTNPNWAVSFNPIEFTSEDESLDNAVQFAGTISTLFGYDANLAPVMHEVLQHLSYSLSVCQKPLNEANDFLDVSKENESLRDELLSRLHDPAAIEFWTKRYPLWYKRDPLRSESAINKITKFTSNRHIAVMFGQKHSKVHIREIMDEGKILLVNLSSGNLGEDTAKIFGAFLLASIHNAARTRNSLPKDKRVPFYVYVDEFQTMLAASIGSYLREDTKYALYYTLANQDLAVLTPEIISSVFGMTNIKVAFKIRLRDDAEEVAKHWFRLTGIVVESVHVEYGSVAMSPSHRLPVPDHTEKKLPTPEELARYTQEVMNLDREKHEFVVKYESIIDPVIDTMVNLESIDSAQEPLKWYIEELKDYCIRGVSRPKEEVREELMQRMKKLQNPAPKEPTEL